MSAEELMETVQRLNASLESLAALGAELRVQTEGLETRPEVRNLLREISSQLVPVSMEEIPDEARRGAAATIRTFFRQAAELLEHPGREPGWIYDDPLILQSQGGASVPLQGLISTVATSLDDLDSRLRGEGGRFLDVGTGVAKLAMAMADAYPSLEVVGIDPWKPALELGRQNVARADLARRVELRLERIEDLPDENGFDLIWMAGPFLPQPVVGDALERSVRALKPGGWLFFGTYAGPDDPVAGLLVELRTIRSGGHPWTTTDALDLLRRAGLDQVHHVERTWHAPAHFTVGRKT